MKMSFKFKDVHHCEAVVLCCIDFRFWKETVNFIENKLGIKSFDFPSLPGSAKAINESQEGDIVSQCIGVPVELHHVKKIIIINHEDCGAYGGSKKFAGNTDAEQEFHISELQKAKEKLVGKYSDKEIFLVYAALDSEKENIEFIIVK